MIRATLITDGSSDRVLIPLLEWVLAQATALPAEIGWADVSTSPQKLSSLQQRVEFALRLYPCDLLFVHRDAEGQPPAWRYDEVRGAVPTHQAHVPVVPVKMQEAWLLLDESAIRQAAGRPTTRVPLDLPKISALEGLADPKHVLHETLRAASGATGRRLRQFKPHKVAHRVAMLVSDWSPLRALPAFQALEADTRSALASMAASAALAPSAS